MAVSSTYYIDTADFSTATAVWTNTSLTTKAPDGYYSFGGNYRQQLSGLLLPIASCSAPPVGCTSYTVSTTSGTGQSYTYTVCDGTPSGGNIGGAGGYDADTFCAQTGSVVLLGSELTLTTNSSCTE
jgi:hypothetical protein